MTEITDSERDPPGQHVGAVRRPAAQPERAGRDGLDGETADLVNRGTRGRARPGLYLERPGLRRDDLAEQEPSVTSSSRLRWADVKVRARIEAVSERRPTAGSRLES